MKRSTLWLGWLAAVSMAFACLPMAMAYTETVDGIPWTYTLDGGKASLGSGDWGNPAIPATTTGAISIPSTLGGCPVTDIGDNAFVMCQGLTSVTIPNSVTTIGYSAFSSCSGLTNVVIPNSVTDIRSGAFSACMGLTSMAIPAGVTNIESGAFAFCSSLTNFSVAGGNPVYKESSGLLLTKDGKTLLQGVVANGTVVIPSGVTSIGDAAFQGCNRMTGVTIPDSVTSIGDYAFATCMGLANVTIPNGVTSIGSSAFSNCRGLTNVAIPASVTNIGEQAFSYCDSMTAFSVAGGNPAYKAVSGLLLTKDGKTLLQGMVVNGDVVIPSGVTSIGNNAFASCMGLTSVTIPNGVKSIGDWAFSWCNGLPSVTIPDSVASIGQSAFMGCPDTLFDRTTCAGVDLVDGWAVGPSGPLNGALVLNGVRGIAAGAFSGCAGLTSVTIPDSVARIGIFAFFSCADLTSVDLGNGVTDIGALAFAWCTGLTSVTIPASVTEIGDEVFEYCNSLQLLYVPESWKTKYVHDEWRGDVFWSEYASVPAGCTVVYVPLPQLELAASSQSFTAAAASLQQLGVTANVAWTASSSAAWLALWTKSGTGTGTILYDVAANAAMEDRTATITVEGGGLSRTFKVTQGGAAAQLSLAEASRTFPAAAASGQQLGVAGNVAWTAKSSASWLTVQSGSGTGNGNIVYSVAAHTGSEPRTATITVSGGGLSQTFAVTQNGPVEWAFAISGGKATVTGANPAAGDLVVPSSLGGCPVSSIAGMAFLGNAGLTGVTMREGLESIGDLAFYNCGNLGGVTIPDSVSNVGGSAFDGCAASLYDTASVPGVRLVDGWAVGKEAGLPATLDLAGVRGIAAYAFYACNGLASVTIPEGAAGIGDYAFQLCSGLAELRIPDSVEYIGANAFSGCARLATLYVPARYKGTAMLASAGIPAGCTVVYCEKEPEPLPEIADASGIADALAGAADARLADGIATLADYNAFRAWALGAKGSDGKPAGAKAVLASDHAWAAWRLGAEALFAEEPVIRIAGLAAGPDGSGAKAGRAATPVELAVRVLVTVGGKTAAVDAAKVATLFRTASDPRAWESDGGTSCEVAESRTEADGASSFTVRVRDGGSGRAFLALRE